jgi:N-methylhydantoinase B
MPSDLRQFDAIALEVCWDRLISIASEQAAAMVNSSFSAVLGEMEDLSAGVFDADATMIAQSVQGAPGHLGSLSAGVKSFLATFPPETLAPGDVLITNDPWLVSGHKHDITVVTPVFHAGRLKGFTASNCHTVDIGGRIFSAAAAEVYEEGLQIPRLKLFDAGRANDMLLQIIRENVRSPELVLGDLMAQVSANDIAAGRVIDLLEEKKLPDLRALSRAITGRTEQLMRKSIAAVPDGVYRDRVVLDGHTDPLEIAVAVEIAGEQAVIDFAGSSPQVPKGINSVLNFTTAFSQYAMKCLLAPQSPNNDGSFAPITVRAPEASIVNARFPAPVGGRHLVGLYIPFAIFGALSEVLPKQVIADSSVLSAVTISGRTDADKPYVFTFFSSGGMGARAGKDGLDATAFPSNVASVPAEIMEQSVPVLLTCRELIDQSAGCGRHRGGAGQRISLRLRSRISATVSCMVERTKAAPRGFLGGGDGRPARLLVNGRPVDFGQPFTLDPGQVLTLETPGGGGYGPPADRPQATDREDAIAIVEASSLKQQALQT